MRYPTRVREKLLNYDGWGEWEEAEVSSSLEELYIEVKYKDYPVIMLRNINFIEIEDDYVKEKIKKDYIIKDIIK